MTSRALFSIAVVRVLSCAAAGRAVAQESGDDVFILDFEGPDVLSAAPGETASGVYFGVLRHSGPGGGALGWSVGMVAENARLTGISVGKGGAGPIEGLTTDAARLFSPNGHFEFSELTEPETSGGCAGLPGAVSGVALSVRPEEAIVLPPRSSSSIFYVVLERDVEGEPQRSALRFVDGCGRSQPVDNVVTQGVDGGERQVIPIKGTKTIEFVPDRSFLRGDTNGSGKVDISDAIRIFMTLFQGADPFPCSDAADTTDDGSTDISDGIRILNDFFIQGTAIPAPGPFSCGPDPTGDDLSCLASSCS